MASASAGGGAPDVGSASQMFSALAEYGACVVCVSVCVPVCARRIAVLLPT